MSRERDARGPDPLPELPDVLRALREEGPGRARLDEIARRLGPALDAPLPAATSVGLLARLFKTKLAAAKFLAAVLTFGALATIALWPERPQPHEGASAPAARAAPAVAVPAKELEARSEVVPAAPVAREAVDATPEVEPAPASVEPTAAQAKASTEELRKRKPPRVARTASHARIETLSVPAHAPTAGLPRPRNEPGQSELQEVEHEAAPALAVDAQVAREAEPEPPPAARPKSELDLIFEARALSKTDPAASLQLIDEHVQRYPDGLLVPEREVLAIEVLRRLGKREAAAARLSEFRKRYPGSVHLRRLEGASL